MHDAIAVVNVRDAFHPELYRRLNRHEKGKEEASIGQIVTESIDEEEENRDELGHDSSLDKFCEHDLGPSMCKRTMLEKQVCKPVQILHLNVGSRQHIRLLVALDESN